jgi:Cys-tRNA(Pro)/Cys-tRNA(Cys) deacylase
MVRNNVTRMLEAKKIEYTAFEIPAEKLSAEEAAQFMEVPAGQVYKTIVVLREGKGKPLLVLVPGGTQVDLKAVARAVAEKKVHLATERQAEEITGLQAGGISPLALLNRGFQVILDASANDLDRLHVSGGERGLNLRLRATDLVKLTNAKTAPVAGGIRHD